MQTQLHRAVHDYSYWDQKVVTIVTSVLSQWLEEELTVCLITVLFAAYANKSHARNSQLRISIVGKSCHGNCIYFLQPEDITKGWCFPKLGVADELHELCITSDFIVLGKEFAH